ncbi:NFACT RNA binding domain-containing protein [Ruminococcus sp.]|uniref:Rqc2 family fibronectin-binding protein n=1 Tax=Ruminococcus sp. TaxID=41978 RepID=UPI0025F3448E|nr:NFACT RNA binding domain-containing protein [Ruminococcus sp.]MBQ8966816.1 NFACT family protein [Ruminococcus sp.]
MALDGVFLSEIKKELMPLVGGRVDKIHQPSKGELLLAIRTYEGLKKLIINTVSGTARLHLTTADIENPKQPPMFCMLMRKHLSSAKLVDIRQPDYERVIMLDFDAANELGDIVRLTITVELMGRRSNLLLMDKDGKIIDSIKRISSETSETPVLPGVIYTLPQGDGRISLTECTREEFEEKLAESAKAELSKGIMKTFQGISPVFARECAFFTSHSAEVIVGEMTDDHKDRLWFYIKKIRTQLENGENRYTLLKTTGGELKDFCFCNIDQYGGLMVTKQFDTPSQLLDYFYAERDSLSRTRQKAQDLFRLLANTIDRTESRVKNQQLELKDCARREQLKQYGDLITANLYQLEKGMTEAKLVNFYDEGQPEVTVKLDKRLTPVQNAQKYFKEYRKLDTAEKVLNDLIAKGEEEARYLDTVLDALTRARTEGDIAALRQELTEQGYISRGRSKGKPPKALPPMRFRSSEGFEIRVGRNNAQNDRLTCKDSRKTDVWLHAKDITGCHVIISCPDKGEAAKFTPDELPPDRTIEEAAVIAAYYSKAKTSSRADVDYTFVKFVKKPAGSKPGMVIFTHNYTITVKPDEDLVQSLEVKQ